MIGIILSQQPEMVEFRLCRGLGGKSRPAACFCHSIWRKTMSRQTDIWAWDAARTATAIRSRAISCREAVAASLDRLENVNAAVNAVVDVMADQALAEASAADEALARGEAVGALHGVPVTVKINVYTAGRATTNGLVPMKHAIATEDGSAVANLRHAG
eukprot:gene57944-79382_t